MCSSSEAGSYSRLIDYVYLTTLGLRVIKKRGGVPAHLEGLAVEHHPVLFLLLYSRYRSGTSSLFFITPTPRVEWYTSL